jgi:hypothetical protein
MREKRMPWTLEEEEIGRRLLEEHASEAEFLEKLGRTKKVVEAHFYYVDHRAEVFRGEVSVRPGPTRQVTIVSAPSIAMNDNVQRLSTTNTEQWFFVGVVTDDVRLSTAPRGH